VICSVKVTNAVKNSLRFNPLGQLKDGPMGISIALSPTQGNLAFSKDAITNASFRARKLPGMLSKLLMVQLLHVLNRLSVTISVCNHIIVVLTCDFLN
jgi:Hyccin